MAINRTEKSKAIVYQALAADSKKEGDYSSGKASCYALTGEVEQGKVPEKFTYRNGRNTVFNLVFKKCLKLIIINTHYSNR